MAADPKAVALFEEISDKTNHGKIPWEPTADEDEFIASIGGKFTLVLRSYTYIEDYRGEREGPPSLRLKDEDGRELTVISNSTEGVEVRALMSFYDIAKRQALRVDEKIDDVLTVLRKQ